MKDYRNRMTDCPFCGAPLTSDKSSITDKSGTIYRKRICKGCGMYFDTQQGPETVFAAGRKGRGRPRSSSKRVSRRRLECGGKGVIPPSGGGMTSSARG